MTNVSALPPLRRRLTDPEIAEISRLYLAGATLNHLGEQFHLYPATVRKVLERAGVPLRVQGLSDEQLTEAIRLYEEGWSTRQIGERLGVGYELVRKRLVKAGVPMRPVGSPRVR